MFISIAFLYGDGEKKKLYSISLTQDSILYGETCAVEHIRRNIIWAINQLARILTSNWILVVLNGGYAVCFVFI